MTAAIAVAAQTKTFGGGRKALDAVGLTIGRGEMVSLIGASGSGKSTLLRLVAGMAAADRGSGAIRVLGRPVQADGRIAPDIRALRADIGMIFQQFNLVGRLSLLTNVLTGRLGRIPAWRGSLGAFTAAERRLGMQMLDRVGLADYAGQRASTLSGGQQQRAAIARTMIQGARVVLADEPIASLDPQSARRVMAMLETLNREDGVTVLVSLHQVAYARACCHRAVALRDGRTVFDGDTAALTPDLLRALYGAESEAVFLPAPSDDDCPAPSLAPRLRTAATVA